MTAAGFERSGIYRIALARRNADRLVEYAKETKRDGEVLAKDPLVRQRLAGLVVEGEIARLLAYRVAWQQSQGLQPEWEASMSRVFGCEFQQHVAYIGAQIIGPYGLLRKDSKWAPPKINMAIQYLLGPGATVAAGTSEIQRNTIAIRGLGLPR